MRFFNSKDSFMNMSDKDVLNELVRLCNFYGFYCDRNRSITCGLKPKEVEQAQGLGLGIMKFRYKPCVSYIDTGKAIPSFYVYGVDDETDTIYMYVPYMLKCVLGKHIVRVERDVYNLLMLECPELFMPTGSIPQSEIEEHKGYTGNDEDSVKMTYKSFIENCTEAKFAGNSSVDLKLMYSRFNKMYFYSLLPQDIDVSWSNRLTRVAGHYHASWKTPSGRFVSIRINLSTHYHKNYSDRDSAENTLLHEMIHALLPERGHDKVFMAVCEALSELSGIEVTRHSEGRALPRYVLSCVVCGKYYVRSTRRKKGLRCGVCHGDLELYDYDDFVNFHLDGKPPED